MPLPRFLENGVPVEPILSCACGYAVVDCVVTKDWTDCPLCKRKGQQGKLESKLNYYPNVTEKEKLRRKR